MSTAMASSATASSFPWAMAMGMIEVLSLIRDGGFRISRFLVISVWVPGLFVVARALGIFIASAMTASRAAATTSTSSFKARSVMWTVRAVMGERSPKGTAEGIETLRWGTIEMSKVEGGLVNTWTRTSGAVERADEVPKGD